MEPTLTAALEEQVLQLADHEAWLDMQIEELRFALDHDLDTALQEDESGEETPQRLQRNVDELKQELATLASMESVKAKVLNHAYAYQVVLKELYGAKDQIQDQDDRLLSAAIHKRDTAVTEYLHLYQELQKQRLELSMTQMKVLNCQDENRALLQTLSTEMAALKEATASQDSTSNRRMARRIEEDLKNVTIKHSVVSNVLLGLLLESDTDWSKDPHYVSLMLKLGGPE
ncbi:hypothetical protein BG006_003904 [Podila minutissima]|uniref:Centromere protein H C-terminal domain-containing protein n=1 Tax=Podila minutissima TaxID=64525 RepID=A0A9P5SLP6_9FUNG|nr:hypothetical protein BG006_003904 [Podila minutissima]